MVRCHRLIQRPFLILSRAQDRTLFILAACVGAGPGLRPFARFPQPLNRSQMAADASRQSHSRDDSHPSVSTYHPLSWGDLDLSCGGDRDDR